MPTSLGRRLDPLALDGPTAPQLGSFLMAPARVPIKLSVVCYEAVSEKLPDGHMLDIPRHWRLQSADGRVLGSGPYPTEPFMLGLAQLAANHTRELQDLINAHTHTTRKVQLLDAKGNKIGEATPDVGTDEWWEAHQAQLSKGVPLQ